MSFLYFKHDSDQSPTHGSLFPSFGAVQDDFFNFVGNSPTHISGSDIAERSEFSNRLWSDKLDLDSPSSSPSSRKAESRSDEDATDGIDGCPDVDHTLTSPYLAPEELESLAIERPWEKVPLEVVNLVPSEFAYLLGPTADTSLRLGPFKSILRFHIMNTVSTLDLSPSSNKDLLKTVTSRLPNADLIKYADAIGLYPLVVRLHLEFANTIPMTPEHERFLQFWRENQRLRFSDVGSTSMASIEYFPGIELKLGKERDTLIRPMVTSVFRSNKDGFRAALLRVGLKYGELRMWKDAQLCTALHVADSFRPGIWAKAVELHNRKIAKSFKRGGVRKTIHKQ